ncbi:MAG: hypothetical protein ACF8TS_14390, partial [Maioricimonas sp. JB049]
GEQALPALRSALKSRRLEVRLRAARLIETIEMTALMERVEVLRQGRIEPEANLPGWMEFRQLVDDADGAGELYYRMVQSEPQLRYLVSQDAERRRAELEKRCTDLRMPFANHGGSHSGIAPETTAALLFVSCDPRIHASQSAHGCVSSLVLRSEFDQATRDVEIGDALRRLLGAWTVHSTSGSSMQRLTIAAKYELPEGVTVALDVIDDRTRGPQIQYAIFFVAKMGGDEHIAGLEELLKNDAVLTPRRGRGGSGFTAQIRDAALVALLHMTDQDPDEYGFNRLRPHSQYLFAPNTAGFDTEEDRELALQKWQIWRRQNLRENLPIDSDPIEGFTL